jgi:glycerol-3-phosphate O-acyltransferase
MTLAQTETSQMLDYRETANIVQGFFAWKPGPVGSLVVTALSKFMRPLEQGTYGGRSLSGEPHRSSWVIASPLTVFVLPERGRRHRLVLAARLRSTGPVNIIEDPPGERKASAKAGREPKKRSGKLRRSKKDRKNRSQKLTKAGLARAARHHQKGNGCNYDLEALIAVQRESDVSLTVVPVLRAYHQLTPDAPATTMGAKVYRYYPLHLLRKATNWARTVRTARVMNCRPIVLSRWLESRRQGDLCSQAAALRIELLSHIESERRACTGPPLPPSWEVRRRVLADPVLSVYMQEYGLKEGMTREAVLAEARGYIDEIKSEYRVGVARYFVRVVDFLFDRFLEGVDVDREGIRFLAECDNRSRIVMVCDHKSYADSLLIGYTMFRSGMVPPQQAAGQNMDFWPMGWLLRHSGAFYIRRSFMGETLYKEVFCAYVRYLLAENYTSVVYIEGTRTRDGKLAKPKIGYLGILEEALHMGVCPDITLVPVYLGFDKIPEEPSHVKEMSGARKVSETMGVFAKIITSIRTRLGKAYVKFGTPMSFKALIREHGLRGAAEVACDEINRITPVTSRSLVGCALLASGETWIPEDTYNRFLMDLMDYCERRDLPMAVDTDPDGMRAALEQYIEEGYVAREEQDGTAGFSVEGYDRRFLEYNKNIQLAHFLEPALASVVERARAAGAEANASLEESVGFLEALFAEEFVFSPERSLALLGSDDRASSHVLCSLLDSYLEGYLVSCRVIGSFSADEPVTVEDAVDACFKEGESLLVDGVIVREESLSRIAFKNALKNWRRMGLLSGIDASDEDGRESTVYVPGERFDERPSVEERIRGLLGRMGAFAPTGDAEGVS